MARSPSASLPPHDHHYASWLPRDIPYSAAFEDAATDLLLSPPTSPTGLHILTTDSPSAAIPGKSLHLSAISPSSLPRLDVPSLPLPLEDPHRQFASPIPGLNLTHPGGYLEGGPGLNPTEDEFARHFAAEHGVRDAAGLAAAVEQEVSRQVEIARERAKARRDAKERNEQIRAEIKTAVDQMELEKKVLTKAKERARERRERKEKRRAGR
ncbi:hypothetical protein K461DRAFT_286946 [Myriangium duriaei CBS 260.36]|uniref:Uncharacterized protein n=1 Tax=Myriangium duriaei CBS 260.36 TaxID=1168546 RepID=A0A9P4IY11_9PEZI|nr:hypothetical protein K461DRAFT_286946 [Myriangium duriaei CBS 260.36]